MRLFIISLFVLLPSIVWAATGDVVYQCTFGASSVCGASTNGGFTGTYPATGGHDNGRYINFAVTGGSGDLLYDPFWIYGFAHADVTVTYWEKYDVAIGAYDWNMKSCRVFAPSETPYFSFTSREHDGYQVTDNPNRTMYWKVPTGADVITWDGCSLSSSSGGYDNYTCTGTGYLNASGVTPDFSDTDWHHVRYYVKPPSSTSATDGLIRIWIDDVLVAEANPVNGVSGTATSVGVIRFHPQDGYIGSGPSVNHSYDDIVVYEGYVPPSDTPATGTLRPGVSASGVTFR